MNIESILTTLDVLLEKNGTTIYKKPYKAHHIIINEDKHCLDDVEVFSYDHEGILLQINGENITYETEEITFLELIS